jgi:DNA-binding GntR family transcriptional regulator
MRLEKIPADEFAAAIDVRFKRSGMKPEDGLGDAIVELAGNLPYDVQRLAHETWDEVRSAGGRRATLDSLHQALSRLLSEQETMFEALWQRLTLPQRAVLRAVVVESGHSVLSEDVRTRHRLGGTSTVQAALNALVRDDVINRDGRRYAVVDSLLREWVARHTF